VQRDTLESLIEEGLGARAWEVDLDAIDQDSWLASLSREDASRLIGQAIGAAKALCPSGTALRLTGPKPMARRCDGPEKSVAQTHANPPK